MKLYIVHDKEYSHTFAVYASSAEESIQKLHSWMEDTKQNTEIWNSHNVQWIADLCDVNKVIE